MKLTYWHAVYTAENHPDYDIRTRTKKAALAKIADHYPPEDYKAPVKRVIGYRDAHNLLHLLAGEDRLYWEV